MPILRTRIDPRSESYVANRAAMLERLAGRRGARRQGARRRRREVRLAPPPARQAARARAHRAARRSRFSVPRALAGRRCDHRVRGRRVHGDRRRRHRRHRVRDHGQRSDRGRRIGESLHDGEEPPRAGDLARESLAASDARRVGWGGSPASSGDLRAGRRFVSRSHARVRACAYRRSRSCSATRPRAAPTCPACPTTW